MESEETPAVAGMGETVTAHAEQLDEQSSVVGSAPLRILSVEDLVNAVDTEEEVLDVPEWGGAVRIRSFTKAEQMEYRNEAKDEDGNIDSDRLELLMLVHGIVEPRLTAEHVGVMRQKRAMTVDRILKRILVLSGLDDKSIEKAEKAFRN